MSWITTLMRKKLESSIVEEEKENYDYELISKDKKWVAEFKGEMRIKKIK